MDKKYLCSACLLGVDCKYDGGNNASQKVLDFAKKEALIAICPERLGGLPSPRPRACRKGDKVIDELGNDKTAAFVKGAQETLKIANEMDVHVAILKQKSPSCGCGKIYEDFGGKIIEGDGVTAELLKKNGIKVISEEEL
ncbi:MAG: DUF523 domain-containing protein [Candidatus Paceibacterota bacterium]